jgi:hypothetical protein
MATGRNRIVAPQSAAVEAPAASHGCYLRRMRDGVWLFADPSAKRDDLDALAAARGWTRAHVYSEEGDTELVRWWTPSGVRVDAQLLPGAIYPQIRMIGVRGAGARGVAAQIASALPIAWLPRLAEGTATYPKWFVLKHAGFLAESPDDAAFTSLVRSHLDGQYAADALEAVAEAGATSLLDDVDAVARRDGPHAARAAEIAREVRARGGPRPMRRFRPMNTAIAADEHGVAWIASAAGEVLAEDANGRAHVLAREQWSPMAIALDATHVWFTTCEEPERSTLARVPRGGGAVEVVARDLAWPGMIASVDEGIVVTQMGGPPPSWTTREAARAPGSLLRVDRRDGTTTTIAEEPGGPYAIASRGGTAAWLTIDGRVVVRARGTSAPLALLERASGTGVAVDAEGHVLAVLNEDGAERLVRVDPVGGRRSVLSESPPHTYGFFEDSLVAGDEVVTWCATGEGSWTSWRRPCVARLDGSDSWDFDDRRAGSGATALTRALAFRGRALRFARASDGRRPPETLEL